MNFFKSKEPDIVEISREKRVKEGIITELSACLKSIQATQLARRPGEPIYTCDSSNQLCTVIEAVFLHGHKSTKGIKRQQSDAKAFAACSFWTFVQRMTHKDTISRLKSLTYTKTEAGVCRAWVRLAINDGLMESYLSTILAQPEVLKQYYSSTALLRDIEQPEILLKLVQMLAAANYDFQLVYNSSQLNAWGVKTLTLAGFVERQVAHGSVSGVISNTSTPRSRSSTLDMEDLPDRLFSSNSDGRHEDVFHSHQSSVDSNSFSQSENNFGRESLSASNSGSFSRSGEMEQEVRYTPSQSHVTPADVSPGNQQTANSYHLTGDNCQQTCVRHQLTSDRHQLTSDRHQLTDDRHQLTDDRHQLTDDRHQLTDDRHQLTAGTGDATDKSSSTSAQQTSHLCSGSQVAEVPSRSPTFQHSPLEAEKELARLRTTSYRISDVIDLTTNMESHESSNDLDSSFPALDIQQTSPSPEHSGSAQESPPHAAYNETESSSTSNAGSITTADITEEPYGTVTLGSSPDGAVCPPANQPTASFNELQENSFIDQSETVFADQSKSSPAAKFVFGTPLSQPEYLPCVEPTPHESDEAEEEMGDNPFLQEELTPHGSNANAESYTNHPFSAAQAILNRTHAHGPQANSYGNSLGSHGNSLASLSGWGGVEEAPSDDTAAEIEPVQSYADLISSYKQAEEEVLGSPIREYTVDPAVLASSNVKPAHEPPAPSPPSFEQTVSADDSENFEVVKRSDEEGILSQYGRLCSEEGLIAQDYKCHSCTAPVGIIYGQPRVCSYTKKYYCSECHINEESCIPAKIVFNWDWAKYSVCKHSKEFLTSAEGMPLLNVQQLNPRLYEHVPALEKMKLLRTELFYLKRYLFACHPTVAEELKQRFWPKEYIYEEIHTYSVQDLLSINANSSLANQMKKGIKSARKHVQDCESCEYRGFLCEICGSPQVIFPFDLDITFRCEKCSAVYHKACMTVECPKCRRVKQREKLLSKTTQDQTLADNLDYSLPQT